MYRKALIICLALVFPFKALAQETPYYVVVGAYSIEANAQRAMSAAHALNYPAVYGYQAARKLHYVFIRTSYKKEEAFITMKDVRSEGFTGAWVYHGELNYERPHEYAVNTTPIPQTHPPVIEPQPSEPTPQTVAETTLEDPPAPTAAEKTTEAKPVPAGKPFIFKLTHSETGNEVSGQIRLQENDRATQFKPFTSNELVYVIPPGNRNGKYFLVCQVIGFKPFRANFSYKDAEKLNGTTIGPNQEIILPVPLERVKRGDYIEMDEVKFFTNSNIMAPESERELKELVNMMNENPKYQIRLHGHTNGNQGRDIVSLGESMDLFHTTSSNKKYTGSAKELSELRAAAVKMYLVQNGIDESRINTRGEGGKMMIFDPKTTLASLNDRVEVEITRD